MSPSWNARSPREVPPAPAKVTGPCPPPPPDWVIRLTQAHDHGQLTVELTRLHRYGLIIIDGVGYLPFVQGATNLFFQPVAFRSGHACLILTCNLALGTFVRADTRVGSAVDRCGRSPARQESWARLGAWAL